MSVEFLPDPWDTLIFEGKPLPGMWELRFPPMAGGYLTGPFEMEVTVHTPGEWRGLRRFVKRAWRPGPINPIGLDHPSLNLRAIREVIVAGMKTTRPRHSTVRVLFNCFEYVRRDVELKP